MMIGIIAAGVYYLYAKIVAREPEKKGTIREWLLRKKRKLFSKYRFI